VTLARTDTTRGRECKPPSPRSLFVAVTSCILSIRTPTVQRVAESGGDNCGSMFRTKAGKLNANQTDAIVIGSGPNGLAAAITLAERGRSVRVLEARHMLGGAVATGEVTLPGFHHDLYSAVYPAGAASPVFARWPLAKYGLRWVHPAVAMAHPLPDGRAAALYRDLDATAANLNHFAPGDGDRWRTLMTPYLRHFETMRAVMLSGWPPVAGGIRFLARFRVDASLEFARLLLLSAEALAHELFRSAEATAWLYGSAMHADVPNRESGSAISGFYLNLLGHAVGWPSPEGGAGQLTRALVGYLHALGGETYTDSVVTAIRTADGRVRSVITANGEEYTASVVIADSTPSALIRLAGDALPDGYTQRLRRYRNGPPSFKVDWALAGPIPWQSPEVRQAGTVHVGGTTADLNRGLDEQREGVLPAHPFLLLGQQSLADPTRAPAGKHTAWGYTHVPASIAWARETERHLERVEAQIERFAPGFRNRILARHLTTPPDFSQQNANLIDGDVGGGSYALDQLIFRPLPSLSPYRTPIRGLYLASASTFPGAAVHGVSGHAAARAALTDARLRRI